MKVAVEATRLRQPPALSSLLKCGQALAGVAFKLIPRNLWKLSHDNNRPSSEGEKRPQQRAEGYGVLTAVVTGEVSLTKPRIRG